MPVYIIQSADGAVKIGRSVNVQARLGNLQTAHAYELKLIRVIDGGAVEEWEFHRAFRHLNIRGEWFKFSPEMLTFEPSGSKNVSILRPCFSEDGERTDLVCPSLVDFVRECAIRNPMPMKRIAELMGLSPASLTRKLKQYPDDSHRFTLDDLERYIEVTNDTQPVLYLVEKYLSRESADDIQKQIAALQKKLEESK